MITTTDTEQRVAELEAQCRLYEATLRFIAARHRHPSLGDATTIFLALGALAEGAGS